MFHAYRSGKQPISGKAWQKLEAAEDAAGIFVNERQVLERQSRTQAENTLHDDAENLDSALCRLLMLLDLPTLLKVLKRLDDKDRIPTVPSRLLTSRIIDTLNERQLEASSESTQPETRS